MNRRWASFVLGLAVALLVGWGLWAWLGDRLEGWRSAVIGKPEVVEGEPVRFQLYFPTDGGLLRAEQRDLKVTDDPRDRARKIVRALLEGPKLQGLVAPFPEGVTAGTVAVSKDGVAYVDLRWEGHPDPPASGSTAEAQRVFSVVNSIGMNVKEATRVVLLWNGFQRDTFAGHLDSSRPFSPDRSLLAP